MEINPKIFKAYDIRGKYPLELNEDAMLKISKAIGKNFGPRAKLVIGHDARLSSPALYASLIKGLEGEKVILVKAGLITAPMLYFLVNKLKATGGAIITASHNPKEYNGLKVVRKNARPISGEAIGKLTVKK